MVAVTNKVTKTPLKCVRAAAANVPKKARVSSNAFKAIPTTSFSDFSDPSSQVNDNTNLSGLDAEEGHPPSIELSPSLDGLAGKCVKLSAPAAQTTSVREIKVPAYRSGAEISEKKPKAADYEDIVNALIVRAATEYESLISTKDAFPNTATRNKWAKKCWINAGIDADEHYVLTDRINSMVRMSNLYFAGLLFFKAS